MMSGNVGKSFRALKVAVIAAVLLLAAIIALPFILDINQFRPELEARFSNALGREVKVGKLKLSLLSGSVEADDITIADNPAFGRSPFVTSESLQIGIELKQLIFSKEVRITRIILDRPAITLIHTSSGKWNFSDLTSRADADGRTSSVKSGHSSEMDIEIRELRITGGRITLIEGRKKPSVCDDVQIVADNLSFASSFPFSLTASLPGGGTLNLEGKAGPLSKKDTLRTPLTAALAVSHFDLVGSGFVPADSGLSGLLDFSGTAVSDGLMAQSKGYAQADKIQFVKSGAPAGKPFSLEYIVDYDLVKQNGTLSDGKIQCGRAIAHLDGNYDRRDDDLLLKMALHGKDMPLQDLTSLLPAFGVTLPKGASLEGGSLNVDLNAEGPIERIVTTGTADISGTRLVGFDLAGKMAGLTRLAGIESNSITEIEKFASAVRLTPEGTYVSDLLLIMPALGELTGEGKVATDRSLDFTMRAMLKPSGALGAGLARMVKGGTLNVPFFIRGTASDPKFIPDIQNTATGLLESQFSGQGSNEGETNSGDSLGNILRNLIKKKK